MSRSRRFRYSEKWLLLAILFIAGKFEVSAFHDGREISPEFSNEWVVHLEGPEETADNLAVTLGYENIGEVRYLLLICDYTNRPRAYLKYQYSYVTTYFVTNRNFNITTRLFLGILLFTVVQNG